MNSMIENLSGREIDDGDGLPREEDSADVSDTFDRGEAAHPASGELGEEAPRRCSHVARAIMGEFVIRRFVRELGRY